MIELNPFEIVMQIINFLILMWILKKLLYKPLMGFLNDREAAIKLQIEQTEANRLESEKYIEQQKQAIIEARSEARSILDKAEKMAANERDDLIAKARTESEKLILNAQMEINQSIQSAKEDLVQHTGKLAISLTEKMLKTNLDDSDRQRIITGAMKQLGQQ